MWTAIFAALLLVILSSFAPQQIDTRVRIKTESSISSKAHLRGESLPAHNASGSTGHSELTSMMATGDEGADRIHCFAISKDAWYAAIFALRDQGWSLDMGGGLDHSWAVLERDGIRIEMEYDIWSEGEMVVAAGDLVKLRANFPTTVLVELGLI
ncbi:hypothetical protein BKP54_00970 [Ensifer sp. 1H6]|nr:hypothetical protein BKP54_00970 [Ensifer sp. 1H6]